ncbi:hypothetical protein [Mycetocola miduiensis]|uniref:Uncharacterized protein n=1 Tax=Mycetocola miduiensis TaxID=995034 RepID=A0A1I5AD72_9MICO|nr:hypothetical protein [Mycetocola miduiensis]SFN60471.1 hypothetical protein SAMN05216219_1369 [Mycetocola miduiensis]
MDGVQAAIDAFNAESGSQLRSAEELFQDWAVAVYLDDEESDRFDIKAVDFGDPASTTSRTHFIEEGWDYGFVEALVNGEWVTVPLVDDAGTVVTSSDNPHGNNTEGAGLTGTSGGAYFVDAQVVASRDLTSGVNSPFEITDGAGNYVYRLRGDLISQSGFSTKCANGQKRDFATLVSNMPGNGGAHFLSAG